MHNLSYNTPMDSIIIGQIETPLGSIGAAISGAGLGRLVFAREGEDAVVAWARRWHPGANIVTHDPLLDALAAELEAYFAGRLRGFSIPLDLRGTPFQLEVWRALLGIGYGTTRAYSELAAEIGHPQAVRAVGAANGANPIPIVVPCHRLIAKGGGLVKYGGGLEVKRRLLELEGATLRA
jgi:O-6-methylguanine DNA methyltransferase